MGTIIHTSAIVTPDGKIEVSTPELEPGQRVDVTIEVQESVGTEKRRAAEILAELPGHQLFKTAEDAEEVDAYIREERDSWDR